MTTGGLVDGLVSGPLGQSAGRAWLAASPQRVDWLRALIGPLALVVGITLLGGIVERVALHRLIRLTERTRWSGDDILVRTLRFKVTLWAALWGASLAVGVAPLDAGQRAFAAAAIRIIFVVSLTLVAADICAGMIRLSTRPDARPALSIVTNVVRATVYVLGVLVILLMLQINISPALAALGVTGLAVSLAMQATLTDFISGIQIIAAKQVQPGDYVQLGSGEEGYVTDIHWRTTTIRQLANNLVIIPNSKMTSSVLTNFHAPEKMLSVIMALGVSYDANLDEVERVTLEVAQDVMNTVAGGVTSLRPGLSFTGFGESSITFNVILRAEEYANQFALKSAFIKALQRRYQQEGIEIPFPVRTLRLTAAPLAMAASEAAATELTPNLADVIPPGARNGRAAMRAPIPATQPTPTPRTED